MPAAPIRVTRRPTITADNVVPYIDWIIANLGVHSSQHTALHMQAAELVIRTRATDAQAKATTATLIDDGTLSAK